YFAGYGFNKSHSAAYAIISFRTAYLKAHYPVEYMAALMTNAIGGKVEHMVTYFAEARDSGIQILGPDVNASENEYTTRARTVRLGLAGIKSVGEAFVESLVAEREKNGPYKTFEDFCTRQEPGHLRANTLECLIKTGAFDAMGHRRSQLLDVFEEVIALAQA